jgi:xylose isomerase
MTTPLRFGAGLWMFGQFVDRYATDAYGPPVSTLEAIARAGQVGELEVVDINYPFSSPDITVEAVGEALEKAKLRAIAVTPAIYDRQFQKGSFTNPDPGLRRKAIERAHEAVAVAKKLRADYVKFWPGQDGYDAPFQAHHAGLWDLNVAGMGEVCKANPDTQFAIEYKAKEPRTHMLLSSAARTLLAIGDMGVSNIGLVIDLGHSLFAGETPSEELELAARRGKLTSVEVNDNFRSWDDDLPVGSVHIVETLEFLMTIRRIGWKKPVLLDQFPFREDPVEAARASIRTIRTLDRIAQKLDGEALRAAQGRQDALATHRLVQEALFGAPESNR